MRAMPLLISMTLLSTTAAAGELTPRGLVKVKGAPAVLPPTEIASFAAG